MNDIVQKIQKIMHENHVAVFGTAGSGPLEKAPSGYRPTDTLTDAKGVFCMGIPMPRGLFMSGPRALAAYWRTAAVTYRQMDWILLQVARVIEEDGGVAAPVFGCYPYEVRGPGDFWGNVSLPRMGETVGIGKRGRNGLLFHSVYGPRLILGGILTTPELPAFCRPETDDSGCPESCTICKEVCPVGAIDGNGEVDRLACTRRSTKSPLFSFLMKTKAFAPKDAGMLNHVAAVDDHSMYTCIRCVSECPLVRGS